MAKIVYVCVRDPRAEVMARLRATLLEAARRLCPDNVAARTPLIVEGNGVIAAEFAPTDVLPVRGINVCAGHLTDSTSWHQVGGPVPEGAFAIFRGDDHGVEVLTDTVGSRSVWHYCDDEVFVAGTSQRAMTMVVGDFQLNRAGIPWLLCNGTPDPDHGWDQRFVRLQPDSRLHLHRSTWRCSSVEQPIEVGHGAFDPDPAPALLARLRKGFANLHFDPNQWVLPLSGGYDSRGILCLLPDRTGLRTVTWGVAAARLDPDSDAGVAQDVAVAMGVRNDYLVTDRADEPIEQLFNRFVVAGEGGIDHVTAYMDGFAIWKGFFDGGVAGVIRGDECFGWTGGSDNPRVDVGMRLWGDFGNLPPLAELGTREHMVPARLERRAGETIAQWRDRLFQRYRIPVVSAALSDLKLSFVEQANPLLSRSIVVHARALCDAQRASKGVFRSVVDQIGPKVRYARHGANAAHRAIMRSTAVRAFLSDYGSAATARALLPASLLTAVQAALAGTPPQCVAPGQAALDFEAVAFRVYLLCRMYELLGDDAAVGRDLARAGAPAAHLMG